MQLSPVWRKARTAQLASQKPKLTTPHRTNHTYHTKSTSWPPSFSGTERDIVPSRHQCNSSTFNLKPTNIYCLLILSTVLTGHSNLNPPPHISSIPDILAGPWHRFPHTKTSLFGLNKRENSAASLHYRLEGLSSVGDLRARLLPSLDVLRWRGSIFSWQIMTDNHQGQQNERWYTCIYSEFHLWRYQYSAGRRLRTFTHPSMKGRGTLICLLFMAIPRVTHLKTMDYLFSHEIQQLFSANLTGWINSGRKRFLQMNLFYFSRIQMQSTLESLSDGNKLSTALIFHRTDQSSCLPNCRLARGNVWT
jgi:hypothetical protein